MKGRKRSSFFTIMIVPHSEESVYSFRMPLFVGKLLVALLVVAIGGFATLLHSYLHTRQEAQEAQILRQVNQVLQEEINAWALEIEWINEDINKIESLVCSIVCSIEEKTGITLPKEEEQESKGWVASSAESIRGGSAERSLGSRSGLGVLDRATYNMSVLQNTLPTMTASLEILKQEVDEYARRMAATPSIWPARGRISSGFGTRPSPFNPGVTQFHSAVDIAGAYGSPIYATAAGRIAYAGYRGGYGNLIIINHGYGYRTYYGHLSRFAVSTGQWVKRGQVIGYMGNSGRTTGTHLHYEVHVNGTPVNPLKYMR